MRTSLPATRVVDFGCGSGVLAVAAALKLGAAAVHAFDIDPQALIATAENAAANGVAARVQRARERRRRCPPPATCCSPTSSPAPCARSRPQFARGVARGGAVVLAGILEPEAPDVTAAYTPWFDVSRFGARDGWAALSGRRR